MALRGLILRKSVKDRHAQQQLQSNFRALKHEMLQITVGFRAQIEVGHTGQGTPLKKMLVFP